MHMGTRKTPLVAGEYYHIYSRGNSKQPIFLDEDDYTHFTKLLYLCNSIKSINFRDMIVDTKINAWDLNRGNRLVSIGAWVLMPNHFHLYIYFPEEGLRGNNLSEFMRKLLTAYSKYFNGKYERTGTLFEGKFKAVHIENDVQAKYLFSYIHLNPLKLINSKWKEEGIKDISKSKKFLELYRWSSYGDHLDIARQENIIISLKNFPKYFARKNAIKEEIWNWLLLPASSPDPRRRTSG